MRNLAVDGREDRVRQDDMSLCWLIMSILIGRDRGSAHLGAKEHNDIRYIERRQGPAQVI